MRIYPKFTLIVLIAFLFVSVPAPKTEAMEPISISLLIAALAPIVLPYILKAMPYIWKGCKNMLGAMWESGVEMAKIGYLFIGLMEVTIGLPFGLFKAGLYNIYDGAIAPFKSMGMMFMVPMKTIGMM